MKKPWNNDLRLVANVEFVLHKAGFIGVNVINVTQDKHGRINMIIFIDENKVTRSPRMEYINGDQGRLCVEEHV